MAPPSPKAGDHSLPPILRIPGPNPMPSCSKAPRGLFVLPRVTRIFTGTSISPSPSLRQRPSRYAIRAGRNLPDKEFRYLRTVIVTAAVHWGFGSKLLPYGMTSPLNLPALAGVSPYTSAFALAETCVFVKQSLGPVICDPQRLLLRQGAVSRNSTIKVSRSRPIGQVPFRRDQNGVSSPLRAPLLPKLRGYFAEFLNEGSLDHLLRIRSAHQCRFAVRALLDHNDEAFLGSVGSAKSP